MATDVLQSVEYPPMIKGSLRLILQIKDAFLSCFHLIEEYRNLLLSCKGGFARELVVYQLTQGVTGIARLREDLAEIEDRAQQRFSMNQALRRYLLDRYSIGRPASQSATVVVSRLSINDDRGSVEAGASMINTVLPPPMSAPDSVEAALHGGLENFTGAVDVNVVQVPEEINLAVEVTEGGAPLLPVVEFYRSFYFLQMHFQLIMCQAANFAMPVVTRQMSLSERAFSWPSIPHFGPDSSAGRMKDKLLEVQKDVQYLAERLYACLKIVREKLEQDKNIETYYIQHTAAQEKLKSTLLRCIQAQRMYIDCLESQNDKLAGLAIKLDPKFAKTDEFQYMTGLTCMPADSESKGHNQNSTATSKSGLVSVNQLNDVVSPMAISKSAGVVMSPRTTQKSTRKSTGGYTEGLSSKTISPQSELQEQPSKANTGSVRSESLMLDENTSESIHNSEKKDQVASALDSLLIGVSSITPGKSEVKEEVDHFSSKAEAHERKAELLESVRSAQTELLSPLLPVSPLTLSTHSETNKLITQNEASVVNNIVGTFEASEVTLSENSVKHLAHPSTRTSQDRSLSEHESKRSTNSQDSSEKWNTNVNASSIALPEIANKCGLVTIRQNQTTSEIKPKPVAQVGKSECGVVCIPDWLHRTRKLTRAEELLEEPKRSAINRALLTHRCKLVQSILRADEEKLEELIALLLQD